MARTVPPEVVTAPAESAATNTVSIAWTPSRKPRSRVWGRVWSVVLLLIVPVGAVVVWWFWSANSTSPYWPPLSKILVRFQEMWLFDLFMTDVVPSLVRLFAGFLIALVIGVALGVVCGRVDPIRRALSPFLEFGRAIPAAALLPIAMILFGIGDPMKVALLAVVCMFPILLNTIDAVSSVDAGFEDTARTFQYTRYQRLKWVWLPFAGPRIFAGARVALSVALIMIIVTEMLASTNGIGFVTLRAEQQFNLPSMWSGMLLLGVLGVLLNLLLLLIQRLVIPWNTKNPES